MKYLITVLSLVISTTFYAQTTHWYEKDGKYYQYSINEIQKMESEIAAQSQTIDALFNQENRITTKSQDEIRFLEFINKGQQPLQTQIISSPLDWYRTVKEFIAKDWFQNTIVRFLSSRTKRDDLEERIGEVILKKVESGEFDMPILLSEVVLMFGN